MKKRSSVRGYMEQRSPGSWTIWIDKGQDQNGKRQRETLILLCHMRWGVTTADWNAELSALAEGSP